MIELVPVERNRESRTKELLFQGICVALLLWSISDYVNSSVPQGDLVDFIATYTAVKLILAGDGHHLYKIPVQFNFMQPLLHPSYTSMPLPYITPPFYVIPFLLVCSLPFIWAFTIVNLISLLLFLFTLKILRPYLSNLYLSSISSSIILLTAACFTPFWINLYQGQNAIISLCIITGYYLLLKQGKDTSAGCILALGLFKPQLNILFFLILLLKKRWYAVYGYTGVAIVLLAISFLLVGTTGFEDYLKLMITESPLIDGYPGIHYYSMHNWLGFFTVLIEPDNGNLILLLTAGASLLGVVILIWCWRGNWTPQGIKFDLQFSLLIIVSLLVNPHLYSHDLTLWLLIIAIVNNMFNIDIRLNSTQRLIIKISIISAWPISALTIYFLGALRVQLSVLFMFIIACALVYTINKIDKFSIQKINGSTTYATYQP